MAPTRFLEKSIQGIQSIVVVFLCASLVVGQSIRFTVSGQGGGLLVSDIAAVIFLLAALLLTTSLPREALGRSGVLTFLVISPFLLWSLTTLILHNGELQQREILIALLYWARLASILLLYPAGLVLLYREKIRSFAKKVFIYTYIIMLLLGYLQLFLFPNLEILGNNWDPHMNRMVGTWLDPNFFGAFLVMCLPAVLLWTISVHPLQLPLGKGRLGGAQRSFWLASLLFLATLAAILLTKSRSTYIAAAMALCACFMAWLFTSSFSQKWKKLVLPAVITVVIGMLFSGILLGERATKVFFHDPTIAIRAEAYKEVWKRLVVPNIFFGVGYNAYQVAAKNAGLIADYQIHSRAGSDSSVLTLLVTTGLLGTALFFIPILLGFMRHYSLIYVWVTVFLLVHSLFVNSLLYPHIVISSILVILLASR